MTNGPGRTERREDGEIPDGVGARRGDSSGPRRRESPTDGRGRSDTDGSPGFDNRWWLLTKTAVAAPIGAFVLLFVVVAITPEESPLATGAALVFLLSIGGGWLTFVIAASKDKATLSERTDRARPRHPILVGVFVYITGGFYVLYYLLRRRQKYGNGRSLLSAAVDAFERAIVLAVGLWSALSGARRGLRGLLGRVRSDGRDRVADGTTGGTTSPPSGRGHNEEPTVPPAGESPDREEQRPDRERGGSHPSTTRPIDLRAIEPVDRHRRTSIALTYRGTEYRCTVIEPEGERWGVAWGSPSGQNEEGEPDRVFTLQYGSRHAAVSASDPRSVAVGTDGTFAAVDTVDGTGRLRVFDPDGNELFSHVIDDGVGRPVVSPGGEYVGAVENRPSQLVVFDGETGGRLIERALETTPGGFSFRRHAGDWWLVGGEPATAPSFGLRLRDGRLCESGAGHDRRQRS